MLEDSVLYALLLMLLPLPKFLVDPQDLEWIPEKIEITVLSVFFEKIAHVLLVRAVELAFAHHRCAPHCFLPKH